MHRFNIKKPFNNEIKYNLLSILKYVNTTTTDFLILEMGKNRKRHVEILFKSMWQHIFLLTIVIICHNILKEYFPEFSIVGVNLVKYLNKPFILLEF